MEIPSWMEIALSEIRTEKLPWVSFLLTSVSFFWIGYRRDRKQLRDELKRSKSLGQKIRIRISHYGPYLLSGLAIGIVLLLVPLPSVKVPSVKDLPYTLRNLRVEGDQPKLSAAADPCLHPDSPERDQSVDVRHLRKVEVSTHQPKGQFEISVCGQFVGDDLRELRDHFKSQPILVYVVVQETRPENETLYWLQDYGPGIVNGIGRYRSYAKLGDSREDEAKNDDLYVISICIPEPGASIQPDPTQQDRGKRIHRLRAVCSSLSLPFYVITRRLT